MNPIRIVLLELL